MAKQTGIKNRMEYLERVINKGAGFSGSGTPYEDYLDSLSDLVSYTNQIYDDYDGMLSKDSLKALVEKYQEVAQLGMNYKQYDEAGPRVNVVDYLQKIISKDLKALTNLDPENPGMIDDAFETSRAIRVEVPTSLSHRVGGQASDRFPMKSTDGAKGFFTARTDTANDAKWNKLLDSIVKMNLTDQMAAKFDALRTNHQLRSSLLDDMYFGDYDTEDEIDAAVATTMGFFGDFQSAKKLLARPENSDLRHALRTLQDQGKKLVGPYNLQDRLGYDPYTRTDNKNAAMHSVAKLLGFEKLVAKAVPMVMVNGGKVLKGTFMEHAKGSDLGNLKGDDPLWDYRATSSPFNKDLYRDLADMQVLDYICGNIDRHKGNMLYQAERTGDGKVKLTGLMAIDNDASFPEADIREFEFQNKMDENGQVYNEARIYKPENFRFVSRKTAEMIVNMDQSQLATALRGHNISKRAIEKACERFEQVKEVLQHRIRYQISYTDEIENKEFKSQSDPKNPFCINDEYKQKPSIFTDFNNYLKEELKTEAAIAFNAQKKRMKEQGKKLPQGGLYMGEYKEYKAAQEKENEAKMAKAQDLTRDKSLLIDVEKIKRMDTLMKHANRLKSATVEFAKMRDAVSALKDYAVELAEKIQGNETLQADEYEKYEQCLNAVNNTTKDYIMKKGITPRTENGKKRLRAAMSIENRVEDLMESFETGKKLDAKEVEDLENSQDDMEI